MRRGVSAPKPLVTSGLPLTPVARTLWVAAVILLWWIVTAQHWVNPLIIPTPADVLTSASDVGWTLADHLLATLLRTAVGFVLGGIVGIVSGFWVQFSSLAQRVILPFLDAVRPVPVIALLPLFILIFGFSEVGRMVLIIVNTAVFLAIATIEAVARVPEQWVRFARISGLSKRSIFLRVLMPAATPFLVGPARLALALAFTVTIAAEFMGAQVGLGYLINTARVNLAIPTIWLAILVLGALSQLLDALLGSFSQDLTSWYRGTEE